MHAACRSSVGATLCRERVSLLLSAQEAAAADGRAGRGAGGGGAQHLRQGAGLVSLRRNLEHPAW
eukprot:3720666-Pleurochrysis_carterae.AAC.2